MRFFSIFTTICHCSLLTILCSVVSPTCSHAQAKKLNLRLAIKSKIDSLDFSSRKQDRDDQSNRPGTPLIKDYFDELRPESALYEMNNLAVDDPEREAIGRRYMRTYVGREIGGLIKNSSLRPYYLKAEKLAEKSRDAVKYDPAKKKPEDVILEVPVTFGIDVSRGIAPTLRAGEHVRFTLSPLMDHVMLSTEWRY